MHSGFTISCGPETEGSRVFGGLAQPETMLKHTNVINPKKRKLF
jgi:hypothetical protein